MTELPWKPVIYLPVDLTVRFDAPALKGDDPGGWCQRKAAELLGPDADRKQLNRLARCLAVMMITNWGEPVFTEAAISIADDMARNFRIEPKP